MRRKKIQRSTQYEPEIFDYIKSISNESGKSFQKVVNEFLTFAIAEQRDMEKKLESKLLTELKMVVRDEGEKTRKYTNLIFQDLKNKELRYIRDIVVKSGKYLFTIRGILNTYISYALGIFKREDLVDVFKKVDEELWQKSDRFTRVFSREK